MGGECWELGLNSINLHTLYRVTRERLKKGRTNGDYDLYFEIKLELLG